MISYWLFIIAAALVGFTVYFCIWMAELVKQLDRINSVITIWRIPTMEKK